MVLDEFELEEFVCKVCAGNITGFSGMGLEVQGCELEVEDLSGSVDGVSVSEVLVLAGKRLLGNDAVSMHRGRWSEDPTGFNGAAHRQQSSGSGEVCNGIANVGLALSGKAPAGQVLFTLRLT